MDGFEMNPGRDVRIGWTGYSLVGTRNTRSKGSEHVWVSIGKPGKWWIYGERMVKKMSVRPGFYDFGGFWGSD